MNIGQLLALGVGGFAIYHAINRPSSAPSSFAFQPSEIFAPLEAWDFYNWDAPFAPVDVADVSSGPISTDFDGYGAIEWPSANDVQVAQDDPWFFITPASVRGRSQIIPAPQPNDPARNRAIFLALIREFETGDKYDLIYGGQRFLSFSDHPRKYVPIRIAGYAGKYSSAAGAYQFIASTWDALKRALGLTDFSPASQDAAALELLRQTGALALIDSGDFDGAMRRAATQWASLPYSAAKQNPKSIEAANTLITRLASATSDYVYA